MTPLTLSPAEVKEEVMEPFKDYKCESCNCRFSITGIVVLDMPKGKPLCPICGCSSIMDEKDIWDISWQNRENMNK